MTQPTLFVINLAGDTERLDWISRQLDGADIGYERFNAVCPNTLHRLPSNLKARLAASPLRPGEIGCWASHLLVMQQIVRRDLPYALILEDDVRLRAGFKQLLTNLDTMPVGWGLLRFAGETKRAVIPVAQFGINTGVSLVKYGRIPMGLGAYAISRRGAEAVLRSAHIGRSAIDGSFRRWWTYDLRTYGLDPLPVEHNAHGSSSIEALGGVARIRRNGLGRLAYAASRLPGEVASWQFLGAAGWVKAKLADVMPAPGTAEPLI